MTRSARAGPAFAAVWQRGSAHRPEPGTRGSASWTGRESRSSWLTGSPQPLIARSSNSRARRGECARPSADQKRWQRRWAAGVTGRRTSSTARREPAVWATRLPRTAPARRAVIDRAPRSWPPRLWPNTRVADPYFYAAAPQGERLHLPHTARVKSCRIWPRAAEASLASSTGTIARRRPRPVTPRCVGGRHRAMSIAIITLSDGEDQGERARRLRYGRTQRFCAGLIGRTDPGRSVGS